MSGRADLVVQHGDDPIAFSTLQDGLRYCETSYGYIAYQRIWGIDISLGPPIAAPSDRAALVERFLRHSRRPLFCYLRAAEAAQVHAIAGAGPGRRLHLAGMGLDRYLDGAALQDPAAISKPLRGARRHAQKADFSVEPIEPAALSPSQRQALAAITAAYLAHSQLPYEMRFLNRPFAPTAADLGPPRERLYLLSGRPSGRSARELFGYAVLNPWFSAGRVAGYLLDIVRCRPTRQWGVYLALVDRLQQDLDQQGVAQLSLGFCPLHGASSPQTGAALAQSPAARSGAGPLSPWLSRQVGWLERYLADVPYVRRLVEIKAALPGHYEPRYFASYSPSALPAFAALLGACGVSLSSIVGPRLLASLWAGARGKSTTAPQ